jgi:hypothetical protein
MARHKGFAEEFLRRRLDQVRIEPRISGPPPILGPAISSPRNELDRRAQDSPDLTADLIAIKIRTADVHEDGVRPNRAR